MFIQVWLGFDSNFMRRRKPPSPGCGNAKAVAPGEPPLVGNALGNFGRPGGRSSVRPAEKEHRSEKSGGSERVASRILRATGSNRSANFFAVVAVEAVHALVRIGNAAVRPRPVRSRARPSTPRRHPAQAGVRPDENGRALRGRIRREGVDVDEAGSAPEGRATVRRSGS